MSFKTLLVHADNSKHCASRIDLSLEIAKGLNAHLVGLYVSYAVEMLNYPFEGGLASIANAVLRDVEADAEKAAKVFDDRVRRAGFAGAEWRRAEGYTEDAIQLNARYADLVVVSQPDPNDNPAFIPLDFPAGLALSVPRPILVIPHAGTFNDVGRNVLVAWNGSREATRAVTDALPLLMRADKVTVLVQNPGQGRLEHGEIPGADLALYLARHGVKVESACDEKIEIDAGEWLLSRAADFGSDLIVMGAYGHRRLREWMLGGATRTVMRSMTVPVLMSH